MLNEKIEEKSFEDLLRKKETHSKTESLKYNKLECQSYLKSDSKLTNKEKQLLFNFRTRMSNVKLNFRNGYTDLSCKLGCNEEESQQHLFQCDFLLNNCEDLANNIKVEYEDIFGKLEDQQRSIKLIMKIWTLREITINETSA